MERFEFYRDEKCTYWERRSFSVDAESYDAAKAIAIEQLHVLNETETITDNGTEILYETYQMMTSDQNNGERTLEIFDQNDVMIANN